MSGSISKFQICFELQMYQYLKEVYKYFTSYKYANILPYVEEVYKFFTSYKHINIQNKYIDIQKVYIKYINIFKEVYQYL